MRMMPISAMNILSSCTHAARQPRPSNPEAEPTAMHEPQAGLIAAARPDVAPPANVAHGTTSLSCLGRGDAWRRLGVDRELLTRLREFRAAMVCTTHPWLANTVPTHTQPLMPPTGAPTGRHMRLFPTSAEVLSTAARPRRSGPCAADPTHACVAKSAKSVSNPFARNATARHGRGVPCREEGTSVSD